MNWLDIAILVIWGGTAVWGASIGLLTIAFHVVALAVAFVLSSRMAPAVGNVVAPLSDNESVQTVAGFLVMTVILLVGTVIASFWVRKILGVIPLFSMANRLGGLLVGALVGGLLVGGLLFGLQKTGFDFMEDTVEESSFSGAFLGGFDILARGLKLFPSDWREKIVEDAKDKIPGSGSWDGADHGLAPGVVYPGDGDCILPPFRLSPESRPESRNGVGQARNRWQALLDSGFRRNGGRPLVPGPFVGIVFQCRRWNGPGDCVKAGRMGAAACATIEGNTDGGFRSGLWMI